MIINFPLIGLLIVTVEIIFTVIFGVVLYAPAYLSAQTSLIQDYIFRTTTMATTTAETTTAISSASIGRSPSPKFYTCTTTVCGSCTSNTATSGTIQSPNYPNDYGGNPDLCTYVIQAPAGKRVQILFTTFIVEDNVDFVNIIEIDTPLTGVFESAPPISITSHTSTFTITFDSSTNPSNSDIPTASLPARWQATFTIV